MVTRTTMKSPSNGILKKTESYFSPTLQFAKKKSQTEIVSSVFCLPSFSFQLPSPGLKCIWPIRRLKEPHMPSFKTLLGTPPVYTPWD